MQSRVLARMSSRSLQAPRRSFAVSSVAKGWCNIDLITKSGLLLHSRPDHRFIPERNTGIQASSTKSLRCRRSCSEIYSSSCTQITRRDEPSQRHESLRGSSGRDRGTERYRRDTRCRGELLPGDRGVGKGRTGASLITRRL